MALFQYDHGVPCYQTADIREYQREIGHEARNLFQLIHERLLSENAQSHCVARKGSFSIIATSTNETAAKIVMYQTGVGHWLGADPGWDPGVYVWVRANDGSGRQFEVAARDANFAHRWVLTRFETNRAVSVAPNPNKHFYYFRMSAEDDRSRIAQLLAFCATL